MAQKITLEDEVALASIERRAETFGSGDKAKIERESPSNAELDKKDFASIQNSHYQRFAAVSMAENMREFPAYKAKFSEAERKQVEDLDKANQRLSAEKEDRKAAEMVVMNADEKAMLKQPADLEMWAIEPTETRSFRVRETQTEESEKNDKKVGSRKVGDKPQQITEPEREPEKNPQQARFNALESDELFASNGANVEDEKKRRIVPNSVSKKYEQKDNTYTNRWNKEQQWVDKTDRIETNTRDANTVSDIVRVAEARGWDDIKVRGSEDFRRQVYLEAAARGMSVRGYQPTQQDIEQVAQKSRNSPEGQGRRATTATTPSEAPELDQRLKAEEKNKQNVQVNEWPVRRQQVEAFRTMPAKEAVKQHPNLAGSYAVKEQAQRVTQEKSMSPDQARVFNERVAKNLENAIERGEPAQAKVQIREREAATQAEQSQQLARSNQPAQETER